MARAPAAIMKSPQAVYLYFRYRLLGRFSTWRLDPRTVSISQAEAFFSLERDANTSLVKACSRHIGGVRTIMDVGANVGFFSRELLRSGFAGHIVLYEPVPNLMSIAVKILSEFCVKKTFVNAAVGQGDGIIELHPSTNSNIGWITAITQKADSQETFTCRMVDFISEIQRYRPDFIKIDVEGYEPQLLSALAAFSQTDYCPLVLCELAWGRGHPNWDVTIAALSKFVEQGFKLMIAPEMADVTLCELQEITETVDLFIFKP